MRRLFRYLDPAERVIGWVEDGVIILLVLGLGGVVNLQIFARYLFGAPFIWPEEMARLLMIWMAFLGSAAVTRRGTDMAVDTFVLMLPPRGQWLAGLMKDAVMIALFAFIALLAWRLAAMLATMPLIATGLSTAMLAWPLALGAGLTALHSALRLARNLAMPETADLHRLKTLT